MKNINKENSLESCLKMGKKSRLKKKHRGEAELCTTCDARNTLHYKKVNEEKKTAVKKFMFEKVT